MFLYRKSNWIFLIQLPVSSCNYRHKNDKYQKPKSKTFDEVVSYYI